jgi:hypothetical protein
MFFRSILEKAVALAVTGMAALAFLPGAANQTYAASLNQNLSLPQALPAGSGTRSHSQAAVVTPKTIPTGPGKPAVLAKALSAAPPPSAVDTANTLNKLLAPGASNPDVPLPQENLAEAPPAYTPLDGPQIYGRREQGGGVLGLKIPIPVDHGAFDQHTRSGSGPSQ